MKKIIFASTLILFTLGSAGLVHASEQSDIKKLADLQLGVTETEIMENIAAVSKQTGLSEEEIIKTSLKELEEQAILDQKESTMTRGGSSGEVLVNFN